MCREAFHLVKLALSTFASETDAPFAYLMEGEHQPRQQVNYLTDENQIAGEGIARRIFQFSGARWFEDKRVRGKRLASEDGAIVGDGGFKAFGINALLWKLTLLLALARTVDAGDASQDISQSSTEDVALVSGHLQRLLDSVGEAVAGKAEVWEHGGVGVTFSLLPIPVQFVVRLSVGQGRRQFGL